MPGARVMVRRVGRGRIVAGCRGKRDGGRRCRGRVLGSAVDGAVDVSDGDDASGGAGVGALDEATIQLPHGRNRWQGPFKLDKGIVHGDATLVSLDVDPDHEPNGAKLARQRTLIHIQRHSRHKHRVVLVVVSSAPAAFPRAVARIERNSRGTSVTRSSGRGASVVRFLLSPAQDGPDGHVRRRAEAHELRIAGEIETHNSARTCLPYSHVEQTASLTKNLANLLS